MLSHGIPLDALYEAVFILDVHGSIQACNQRAIDLFHAASEADFIGQPATTLFASQQQAHNVLYNNGLTTEGESSFFVQEARVVRINGATFTAEVTLHPLSDTTRMLSIRDISIRVKALRDLEEANERLRIIDRERMNFVSNVSHELRTPLTSMSYALANMHRGICGQLPEKATDYIARLQTDVRRLLLTVNDILDLRQLERGTLVLQKTTHSLTRLLASAIDSLRLQAEAKNQTLRFEEISDGCYALIDPHKIERVFVNIIANAIKYTQEKGTITLSIQREGEDAILLFDDNGVGIPQEAIHQVSLPYYRVGSHVTGTGLGLAIVKELTEMHQGSFSIQSPVPMTTTGTRVKLRIPLTLGPLWMVISGDESFISLINEVAQVLGCRTIVDRAALDIASLSQPTTPKYFIIDGDLPESSLEDIIFQIRSTPALAQSKIMIVSDQTFDASRRYTYARMHVTLCQKDKNQLRFCFR